MDIDPERINGDHWREQDYQAATPFMPFQPMQLEQPLILPRAAGIDVNGLEDANDPGHPGQQALPYIAMRPPVPAPSAHIPKKNRYTAAAKFLATFRT